MKGNKMNTQNIEEEFENYKEHRWNWIDDLPDNEKKAWTDFYNIYYRSSESFKDFMLSRK
jgi:hypothetical protein